MKNQESNSKAQIKYLKKIIKKVSGIIFILAIITIWVIQSNTGESLQTATDTLSNTKICWGVKRAENNEQPDLGETNIKLMEKYNGIYMGNSEKTYVYLTFDAGYEAGYTEKILDVLKKNEVTATFFITAHYSNTASDLVQRMIDEGHIIRKSYSKSQKFARFNRRRNKRRSDETSYSYI